MRSVKSKAQVRAQMHGVYPQINSLGACFLMGAFSRPDFVLGGPIPGITVSTL